VDPEQDYERGALPEREYAEGGPRKLAKGKISAMDDKGKFRPTF
jgi:hypothetical protein